MTMITLMLMSLLALGYADSPKRPMVKNQKSVKVKKAGDPKIHIQKAVYLEDQKVLCHPDLSICEGLAECSFTVTDSLCPVEPNPGSARNLEVTYDCGDASKPKGQAAARDTTIKLTCP